MNHDSDGWSDLKCSPSRPIFPTGSPRRNWWECQFERFARTFLFSLLFVGSSSFLCTWCWTRLCLLIDWLVDGGTVLVVLYLMDNNEKTSWMILFSQGTGLCIEAWKITKAVGQSLSSFSPCVFSNDETDSLRCWVDVAVVPATVGFLPYTLSITDKHVLSEEELKTQEYDQLAFRWVSYVRHPVSPFFFLFFSMRGVGRELIPICCLCLSRWPFLPSLDILSILWCTMNIEDGTALSSVLWRVSSSKF